MDIKKLLFEKQDLEYREFHAKLIPTVDKEKIIGVRVPDIRKIAKELKDCEESFNFMKNLPHRYYEENNLHAFFIEQIKDYDECVVELNRFLPYVDNWATCDSMRPKCFKKNKDRLNHQIKDWIKSDKTYTVRFGIEMLMVHYLGEGFDEKYLKEVSEIKSDEYYINIMIAWYFATALAKQWDFAVSYIEQKRLPLWIHNKTIQKAVESYRLTKEEKEYFKKLKII